MVTILKVKRQNKKNNLEKMATIRFIREDLEVQCNPGEYLRELVMKENLQLYGLKGILGNCGGAGQCSLSLIHI